MTVTFAWLCLVTLGLVMNAVLTFAVLNALRRVGRTMTSARPVHPFPGTALRADPAWNWPADVDDCLNGDALVAFVVPGCVGCRVLRAEFDGIGRLPLPLVVIADSIRDGVDPQSYLDETWSIASHAVVSPQPLALTPLLGAPNELPVIAVLEDGRVVASAHRLDDLRALVGHDVVPTPLSLGRDA
jgi:hypothetical protein